MSPINADVLSAGIGSLGSLAGSAISALGASNSARRAYQYSRKLMQYQYDLNQLSLYASPYNTRRGLVNAGYNPLLALGSQGMGFSASSSMSPNSSGLENVGNAVSSAMDAMALRTNIENTKSQTQVNEATSALSAEQAKTEQSKRTNLEFQNAMLDVQKHLADKDLSWYDRKAYMTLYNQFQQAENYKAQSAIGAMNAETARQSMINNYNLGRYHNDTERRRSRFQNYKDYQDSKYGNPLKTAGFSWDKNTSQYLPEF